MSSDETASLQSRLKFRACQPVDIPRCYQLECSAYPSEATQQSKSWLQQMQHHAAPFFRCVLLKKSKEGRENNTKAEVELETDASHHVVHGGDGNNELIGYICGSRCHDAAPMTDYKHEPDGKYLAIHSIVVQKEYQRLGVAKALLEYYINAIEIHNAELDEAGKNRRRNKLKGKYTKIERIILMSRSTLVNLLLPFGFRWKSTVTLGGDPVYEMERVVSSFSNIPECHPLMKQDCFLVDTYTHPQERMSGKPASVVVMREDPAKLIYGHCSDSSTSVSKNPCVEAQEDMLAGSKAEVWMNTTSHRINQPVTAFLWPITCGKRRGSFASHNSSLSLSDDGIVLSQHEENSDGSEVTTYSIRCYTSKGTECAMSSNATLAAASVLFSRYLASSEKETMSLAFHSRDGVVVQATLVSPAISEEFPNSSKTCLGNRIAIDYPWITVERVPPEGEGGVLSMLRSAFFGHLTAVSPSENSNDTKHDELAFSLSLHHINFMGVTSDGEDLLIELSTDGFNMLFERKNVDYAALRNGWDGYNKGVIVCCEAADMWGANGASGHHEDFHEERVDFKSRYFAAKGSGSSGDFVSNFCALGPYFGGKMGKARVRGKHDSDGGCYAEVILNESEQIVCVLGCAEITLAGKTLGRID